MIKDLEILKLFELYGELLTEKQKNVMELSYLYDLSLSEIAEEMNVKRQSVNDFLKSSKESLLKFETKLKLKEKIEKINNLESKNFKKDIINILENKL